MLGYAMRRELTTEHGNLIVIAAQGVRRRENGNKPGTRRCAPPVSARIAAWHA